MEENDVGNIEEIRDNVQIGVVIGPVNRTFPQSQPQGDECSYPTFANVRFGRAARSERALFNLFYAWDPAAESAVLVYGDTSKEGAVNVAILQDLQRVHDNGRRCGICCDPNRNASICPFKL